MRKIIVGIAAVGILSSCQQVAGWFGSDSSTDSTQQTLTSESVNRAKAFRDESITRENAYSDLFLDSAAIESYIQREKLPADRADRMREFYIVRSNQYAWFTSEGATEQARGFWGLYESVTENQADTVTMQLRERMDSLLTRDSAVVALRDTASATRDTSTAMRDTISMSGPANRILSNDSLLLHTELALTAQYVNMALQNKSIITTDNFYWLVPRKKIDAMQLADSLLNREKDSSVWQNNTQYQALKTQLQHYYTAAKEGGWQPVPSAAGLRKGVGSPAVVLLKKRLAATGDYPAGDTTNVYSDSLATAISAVQQQYGFAPTGLLTDSLVQELNVPAVERVQQILVNMNRVLWLPQVEESSHIVVNIPSQELVVYGDTAKMMTLPVIVGKEGSGTMAFTDEINKVVFSPYWNIPESIVRNEIMPAMKKDPNYLKKRNMEIVRQDDSLPQIRQLPGADNAMGRVKFLFPNSFDIYLHDTPNKALFAQQNRALSHGCIRVAQPDSLARFVLRNQPEWTPEKIRQAMNGNQEQTVEVKSPVPVSITYYTAWVGEGGKLNFRKDLYGYDKRTAGKMFTNTTAPA